MQKLTAFAVEFVVFLVVFILVTEFIARSEMVITEAILVFVFYKVAMLIWNRFGPQTGNTGN
jgi:hypothetical protein